MILALVLAAPTALATPKLNEFMYDRSGASDAHKEWVELCDYDADATDLTGWQLQYAGVDWAELYTYTGDTINPGDHLVHGGYDFIAGMWNGEAGTSGLRLVDPDGNVVDTILYAPNNIYGLLADDGTTTSPPAPDVPKNSDQTLSRYPDCSDTDNSSIDVVITPTPTEGKKNRNPDGVKPDQTPSERGCGGSSGDSTAFLLMFPMLPYFPLRRRRTSSRPNPASR